MSIKVADNFLYQGRKPLDNRILIDTIANMVAMSDAIVYDGMIAYVKGEKKFYVYDSSNTVDATLKKWRELSLDGASVEEYKANTKYKKNTLIYLDNQIARATKDFTSGTPTAPATLETQFESDDTSGNITILSYELKSTSENITFDGTKKKFTLTTKLKDYKIKEVIVNGLVQSDGDYTLDETNNTIEFDIVYDTFDKGVIKFLN